MTRGMPVSNDGGYETWIVGRLLILGGLYDEIHDVENPES